MPSKIFKIDSSLYSPEYITDAIGSFEGYVIKFSENIISIDDENPQYIFDELMNHVLSLTLENPLWV